MSQRLGSESSFELVEVGSDCPTAWMYAYESSLSSGDYQRAAVAQQQLGRLGVVLCVPTAHPSVQPKNGQHLAELRDASGSGERLVCVRVAARRLRVTKKWLEVEVKEGRVPSLLAGRRVLLSMSAVEAALLERAAKIDPTKDPNYIKVRSL